MKMAPDFASTYEAIQDRGILEESPDQIHKRLTMALQGVGATQDLGLGDWIGPTLRTIKSAVRQEVCDPNTKALRKTYQGMIDKGLTADGVAQVTAILIKVVTAVSPTFAVPSVVILLSVWLLKVGANYWCSFTDA